MNSKIKVFLTTLFFSTSILFSSSNAIVESTVQSVQPHVEVAADNTGRTQEKALIRARSAWARYQTKKLRTFAKEGCNKQRLSPPPELKLTDISEEVVVLEKKSLSVEDVKTLIAMGQVPINQHRKTVYVESVEECHPEASIQRIFIEDLTSSISGNTRHQIMRIVIDGKLRYMIKGTNNKEAECLMAAYQLWSGNIIISGDYKLKLSWHERLWAIKSKNHPDLIHFQLLHAAQGERIAKLNIDINVEMAEKGCLSENETKAVKANNQSNKGSLALDKNNMPVLLSYQDGMQSILLIKEMKKAWYELGLEIHRQFQEDKSKNTFHAPNFFNLDTHSNNVFYCTDTKTFTLIDLSFLGICLHKYNRPIDQQMQYGTYIKVDFPETSWPLGSWSSNFQYYYLERRLENTQGIKDSRQAIQLISRILAPAD